MIIINFNNFIIICMNNSSTVLVVMGRANPSRFHSGFVFDTKSVAVDAKNGSSPFRFHERNLKKIFNGIG